MIWETLTNRFVVSNFSRRKISRLIKSFIGVKINKISHGKYQKIS